MPENQFETEFTTWCQNNKNSYGLLKNGGWDDEMLKILFLNWFLRGQNSILDKELESLRTRNA